MSKNIENTEEVENEEVNEEVETETENTEEVENEEGENNYEDLVKALAKANEELEKFKHFNRKLETEKRALKIQVIKTQVLKEFGLPEGTEALLEGKNETELREKATALAALLAPKQGETEPKPQQKPNPLAGLNAEAEQNELSDLGAELRTQLSTKYNRNSKTA